MQEVVKPYSIASTTQLHVITHNNSKARCLYDSLGYGYFEIVALTQGILYSIQADRSQGMTIVGQAVRRDLQLIHDFKLSRTANKIDADIIEATVDGNGVDHTYNAQSVTVNLAEAGSASA